MQSFTIAVHADDASSSGLAQLVNILPGGWWDYSGRNSTAGGNISFSFDKFSPVPLISTTATYQRTSPMAIAVSFQEGVYGFPKACDSFSASRLTLTHDQGGAVTASEWEAKPGDSSFFTNVSVSGDGWVSVLVAAGAAQDSAGNPNVASNTLDIKFDGTPPTVALTASDGYRVAAGSMLVTATFSEVVYGLELSDFDVPLGSVSGLTTVSDDVYTLTFLMPPSVSEPDGAEVSLQLPANKVNDFAGNPNLASPVFKRIYDPNNPLVTLSSSCASDCNSYPIPITVVFNEAVTGVSIQVRPATLETRSVSWRDSAGASPHVAWKRAQFHQNFEFVHVACLVTK